MSTTLPKNKANPAPIATLIPETFELLKLGDYVLASRFPDAHIRDPWHIGFVVRIIEDKHGTAYIIGEEDWTWSDNREYRHVRKLTREQGDELIAAYKVADKLEVVKDVPSV
jgi:hypothetical protein